MKKLKLTPTEGPWRGQMGRTLLHIKGPDGQQITEISMAPPRLPTFDERMAVIRMNQANGNLIISAPELLKALKVANAALRNHPRGDNRTSLEITAAEKAIEKVYDIHLY